MASIEAEHAHVITALDHVDARLARLLDDDIPLLRRDLAQYRADHVAEWSRVRGAIAALAAVWTVALAAAALWRH